jgi:polyferredoxin
MTPKPSRLKRIFIRLREDSQFLRSAVQLSFVLLCLWIGVEFYLFTRWGTSPSGAGPVMRPPGVEGFLPISAMISLKYWIFSGAINTIHPAGLFIFLAIVAVSVLLKKAFCSWLCPIGTLSEALWMLGRKVFGKNIALPRWADYPLRSVKYLLLFFFGVAVWTMDVPSMREFIDSPYNKVADIKMFLFFANITTFALWAIIVLMALSAFVQNFWCRYLCPYGALLGALSWLSPVKVTRNAATCIDCELCTKACPSNIRVHTASKVWSDECMSCLQCIEVCPVKETLELKSLPAATRVPNWVFGALVAGIFVAVTGLAIATGHWKNSISAEEYRDHFSRIESAPYNH